MKRLILSFLFLNALYASSQVPEDALRYSWFPQNGTARTLSIGGVMGSLGGDLTAAYVNPAGLGFYRTGDIVVSPGFIAGSQKGNFRGADQSEKLNAFSIGPTGIIIAGVNRYDKTKSSAFAVSFTQTANFKNTTGYKGLNNYSSFSEQFAEEFSSLNSTIDNVLNTNSIAPYTAAPALYTYLIDTVTLNGTTIIKGAPQYVLEQGKALQQEMLKNTKGGLYELNFAFAGNDGDKWLYGASVGIPIISFESNTVFSETDTSGDDNNYFRSFTFTDNFTTKGAGLNARVGLIYRPQEYFRLGLAVHTPTYMTLTDSRASSLTTSLENPVLETTADSKLFTEGKRGEASYIQTTPWRAIVSASYVFRETEDVTKQRGFASVDVEYVQHRGSRFRSEEEEPLVEEVAYFKQLNDVVKDIYKGNINLRAGGELKFNKLMARLGFGFYGSPYKDAPVKANKMTLSTGAGYRHKGFFFDLGYVHLVTKDFDVPYRLENKQNTIASLKQTRGNVVATIGFKL